MSNHNYTNEAGKSRRRMKSLTVNFPAAPLNPKPILTFDPANPEAAPTMQIPPPPTASVMFVREDRIIMADGSEKFITVDSFVKSLDAEFMSTLYSSIDIETGIVDDTKQRYGGHIAAAIIDGFKDIFIAESMARDYVEPELNPAGKKGKGKNKP